MRCIGISVHDKSSTPAGYIGEHGVHGLDFPHRCVTDLLYSLHFAGKHADSPLVCCRSVCCTVDAHICPGLFLASAFFPRKDKL